MSKVMLEFQLSMHVKSVAGCSSVTVCEIVTSSVLSSLLGKIIFPTREPLKNDSHYFWKIIVMTAWHPNFGGHKERRQKKTKAT